MKRRQVAWAGVALGAAAAGWAWHRSQRQELAPPAAPGVEIWSQELQRPDGSPLRLSTLRGQPLIVNFWATWCPPCVREMPMIERFYQSRAKATGRQAWRILGLAVDRQQAVVDYLRQNPVTYDIAVAGFDAMQWGRDWGNDKNGLPFTVAFAADGRILRRKLGELGEGELDTWPTA